MIPGQARLAPAWVLARAEDVVPIPGTRRVPYLDEALGARSVRRTGGDLARIDAVRPAGAAAGERYQPQAMPAVNR